MTNEDVYNIIKATVTTKNNQNEKVEFREVGNKEKKGLE